MADDIKRPGVATTTIRKSEILIQDVVRFNPKHTEGLSSTIVESRIKAKLTNKKPNGEVKSLFSIFFRNFFSFFNTLLYIIGAALIYIQDWGSLFFLVILLINIMIGLIQDIKARHTLKKLLILNKQKVTVVRDGIELKISTDEVVLDDIIKLKLGDQVAADGIVIHGQAGVNESLLTGEPDIMSKVVGSDVLSGSFVTTGTCYYRVDTIGKIGYAQTLQLRAKVFKRQASELLNSIKKLFRVIGIIVIIMTLLLVFNAFYQQSLLVDSIRSISGSLVAMIPSGMYLLTSMTLAVGVIRLGRKKTLVNEMYSIEMLARVNVLCLDKTGTITDGTMKVNEVITLKNAKKEDPHLIIGSIVKATQDENPTALALAKYFKTDKPLKPEGIYCFNSETKYSAATFGGVTYAIGASSLMLNKEQLKSIATVEKTYLQKGLRVLVLASAPRPMIGGKLPVGLIPLFLIVIQDNIRKEAFAAIDHFQKAGVQIKIISGDDPISVGEIARQVGINDSDKQLDLSSLERPIEYALDDYAIYGRVRPEQKEGIITRLQKDGKVVAMIGDGVNDVLALKAASCSIAMGEGSAAARGVSHLVLLDNNFSVLPSIVDEGRRAINNLQKTWSLFLVKTVFAIVFSLIFVIAGLLGPAGADIRYPFETKHLYLWEILSLGVPAFFLSMQPNKEKVQGTFIRNVMLRSLPAGLFIATGAFMLYILKNFEIMMGGVASNTSEQMITMGVLTLTFLSFVVLYRISRPMNRYRLTLFIVLAIAAIGVLIGDQFLDLGGGTSYFTGVSFATLELTNIIAMVVVNIVLAFCYVATDRMLNSKKGD